MLPIEGDRWIVSIADRRGPPRIETWDSFLAALTRLITPTLYKRLRHAEPTNDIRHYGFFHQPVEAFRTAVPLAARHIADWGRDLPVQSDPRSGHVVRCNAGTPAEGRAGRRGNECGSDCRGAGRDSWPMSKSVLRTPWNMSTGADLAFPEIRGERPENFEESRKFEAGSFPRGRRRSDRASRRDGSLSASAASGSPA